MLLLLPPSEGKAKGGRGAVKLASPAKLDDAAEVLREIAAVASPLRSALYGVNGTEKAEAAHMLNAAAVRGPAMPALLRYTGVVYTHIDPATLASPARAGRRVLIVSALYGLIRGADRIADYKLPMAPRWARFWRERNAARLAAIAGRKPVVSLLPQAHAAAIHAPGVIHIEFRTAGGAKSAGHFGKAIKGRFVRFILEEEIDRPEGFEAFREDGYRWNGTAFIQE